MRVAVSEESHGGLAGFKKESFATLIWEKPVIQEGLCLQTGPG